MKPIEKWLPLANAALCAAVLILLVIDAIWPLANLFLNGFVKLLLLVTCLVTAGCGALLASRQRRALKGSRRPRRY